MIRPADTRDRFAFHRLAQAYLAESGQRREYSEERTQQAFEHAIGNPSTLLLVADGQDGLAGGVLAMIDHAFTVQPVCLLSMFYVRPEYRGTPLARALIQGAVAWADSSGCSHTFASANAQLGDNETQLFVNLVKRFGFEPCGSPVLCRRTP